MHNIENNYTNFVNYINFKGSPLEVKKEVAIKEPSQELPSIDEKTRNAILAQNTVRITTDTNLEPVKYSNNLKTMFNNNQAKIMAVIPRTMGAKDTNGDGLISEDEERGDFLNAVGRLDELKNLGINTLHILPISPPGKINAMGTAGSLYSPADFLEIDPELKSKNDPRNQKEQFRNFINECHKRGMKVMLDIPSCASIDLARKKPSIISKEKNGEDKTPGGWNDIRMLRVWDNEKEKVLNQEVLQIHKDFVDMCIDLKVDGIRVDVARSKPIEFWNVIIPYSHTKDPEFAWLAESYTYEDASPMLNMPEDRPEDLLKAGFDAYYGQYHIYNSWNKASDLYNYVIQNIKMNNKMKKGPKALIGSFSTHDDPSPMLFGGPNWIRFTTGLQATLPQLNPYFVDGVQSGDTYLYPYKDAVINDKFGNKKIAYVHQGQLDIFNPSRRPGGEFPEIGDFISEAMKLKSGKYEEIINKGSFIPLSSNDDEVIAFLRHYDKKTLLVIANRNLNKAKSAKVKIPGLKESQQLTNLLPKYGKTSRFQPENNRLNVELGEGRIHVFEIETPNIEKSNLKIYKQKI